MRYQLLFQRPTGLNVQTAIAIWDLMLKDKCTFLQQWISFIEIEKKDLVVIQKDTWYMLLELIESTGGDFSKYEDDGAWPVLIDEFQEFYSKSKGK